MNLNDLRSILGLPFVEDERIFTSSGDVVSENDVQIDVTNGRRPARTRRLSMERMQLVRITPDRQQQVGNIASRFDREGEKMYP